MREIKFKALYKGDLDIGEYLPFIMKEIDYEIFFVMECNEEVRYPISIVFSDDEWIKLQYTGLKDNYGNEIYESDTVNCPTGFGVVEYDTGTFIIVHKHLRQDRNRTWTEFRELVGHVNNNHYFNCEIIGNKYKKS